MEDVIIIPSLFKNAVYNLDQMDNVPNAKLDSSLIMELASKLLYLDVWKKQDQIAIIVQMDTF
jgi:hypothetical protein